MQLSKKMKAYIKNNAIDNIQELNENVKKATNNKKQEKWHSNSLFCFFINNRQSLIQQTLCV